MKKAIAHGILLFLCVAMALTGCNAPANPPAGTIDPVNPTAAVDPATTAPANAVELTVVTSYGGEDGNRPNYEAAFKAWEATTGNKVLDNSGTSNEEWKAKVNTDFESGTEPDVLFYFTGADADSIIKAGKVVSLETIRAEYPEYGSNMVEDSLPLSSADGMKYALPTTGFWEGMFTNVKLLNQLGIAIPDANYTWEQFLADCQTIKDAGYTPIACSLQEVPHYWFEFAVMNNGSLANQLTLPVTADDEAGTKWSNGLADIKELYEKGFFSENTLTATDNETFQAIYDGDAAFVIDGSWKIGAFVENAGKHLEDYQVLFVPGKGERKAGDIIGGLSMGYYITQKAWNDPAKRAAAVSFVQHMTSDDVINKFAAQTVSATALKNPKLDASNAASPLHASALNMLSGITGIVPAVQDTIKAGKADLLGNIKNVVSGGMSAADALASAIALFDQAPAQ